MKATTDGSCIQIFWGSWRFCRSYTKVTFSEGSISNYMTWVTPRFHNYMYTLFSQEYNFHETQLRSAVSLLPSLSLHVAWWWCWSHICEWSVWWMCALQNTHKGRWTRLMGRVKKVIYPSVHVATLNRLPIYMLTHSSSLPLNVQGLE